MKGQFETVFVVSVYEWIASEYETSVLITSKMAA